MNSIQKFEMWLDEMDNQLEEANKAGVPLIVKEYKEKGYQPKIDFWKGKLNLAIQSGNVGGVEYATKKVQYFMNRQIEVYGG